MSDLTSSEASGVSRRSLRSFQVKRSPISPRRLFQHRSPRCFRKRSDRSEIAVVLGCSKAAVSVRLHRARRRVQRALDALDYRHGTNASVIAIPGGARNVR
jgi:hypothetical protein